MTAGLFSTLWAPLGKGGYISVYVGVCTIGLIKGDTRGLEYSSYGLFSNSGPLVVVDYATALNI